MRRATITLALVAFLASSGCETSTAIKNQQYYLAMARAEIESYRVPDRKEFYGFVLGDELKGRENHHGTPDEETGGIHYNLPDAQGMFDFVVVRTDPKGVVLRIQFYKAFTSGGARSVFFNAVVETLKTTYPVYEHSGSVIWIRAAESDDDWLRMYSEYLKRKDEWVSSPSPFYYILHPTLALVTCATFDPPTGEYGVGLEFTSKEYYRALEFHKRELQQRLSGLSQTGPSQPLEEGHSSPELTTVPLEQQPAAAQSTTLAQTDPEIVESWKAAAMQGDAGAQVMLGLMYQEGKGVPQDYAQAAKWFTKAGEQGDDGGHVMLGLMYQEGKGVPQDYAEAAKWFAKAAEQGDDGGQVMLGLMYRDGKGVPQDFTEAVKWYRRAADQGHALAQYCLAVMYGTGRGVPQDNEEAVNWYRRAAEQSYPDAQHQLGLMYLRGYGVVQDYEEAVDWFKKAAEQGHAIAQGCLGDMYRKGQGVPQDYAQAAKWYTKVAEQGNADAQACLGEMYYNGQGVLEDYAEAYKWTLLAQMNGSDGVQRLKDLLHMKLTPTQIEEGQRRAREFMAAREGRSEVGDGPRVP